MEPEQPVDVPLVVRSLAGNHPVRCVWRNEFGGLTFEVVGANRFVKFAPAGTTPPFSDEVARLDWAGRSLTVPRVLGHGVEDDGTSWLMTAAIPGDNAVDHRWLADPRTAVRALGEGLRLLHESLPSADCPFTWSADDRLGRAHAAHARGALTPARWHADHAGLTPEQALARVATPPPVDRLVVCHGDACAPNTVLLADGRVSGFVDLGRMGTGDRWADLAVATWSTQWNYGPDWEGELLASYGVAPDEERTRYYRLLWDLAD